MTTQMGTVKELKEGKLVVIDNEPCRVVGISESKTGKHGAGKARVEAISLFTGSKKVLLKPVDAQVDIPMVDKKVAQIIAQLGNNRIQLMDLNTFETFELECPPEFAEKAKPGAEVEIHEIMGRKMLQRVKG